MSDKIEEIRARHELVGGSGSVIHPTGWCWSIPGWVAHADRATLLAEVARLRVEIEGLRAQLDERYIAMRVRQLEEALDAERQTARRLRENVDRLGKEVERADRLREEIARVKSENRSLVKRALEGKP